MVPNDDLPLNIAHRGASKLAPQNTLTAFEKAVEVGADGIEFDVRFCADGVPVVIHDATVDATTDGTGRVERLTLAQLKELDAGSSYGPAFAGERIPTLAEVMETVEGNTLLNIELKGGSPFDCGLEQAVVDVIKHHGREGDVLISSFNPFALRRLQQIAPSVPTGLLYLRPAWPTLSLASLVMPRRTAALHPHRALVDERHVRWARARNSRVYVWTVDDPADMSRFIELQVDGIITNAPGLLQEVLETAG